MGKRDKHVVRDNSLFLSLFYKSIKVVADNLSHTGRGDRKHLWMVKGIGILQSFKHVVQPAKDCSVLCHGCGDGCKRLLEMPVQMAPEIGHAALGTLNKRNCAFKS